MTCSHTREEPGYWRQEEDWYTGEMVDVWTEGQVVPTTEDIDTGRYRCTQCRQVMYYTGRWRDIYEGNTPPDDYERKWMGRK